MKKIKIVTAIILIFYFFIVLPNLTKSSEADSLPIVNTTRHEDKEKGNTCYVTTMTDGINFAIASSCVHDTQSPYFYDFSERMINADIY